MSVKSIESDKHAKPKRHSVWAIPLGAGLLHGLVMGVALPPLDIGLLALLAVMPIAYAVWWGVHHKASAWKTGLWAFIGALPFWGYTEWWIADISRFGFPFLVAIEAAWVSLAIWLAMRVFNRWPHLTPLKRVVAFGVIWCGVEFFRGELFGNGYAWGLVSYPLIDSVVANWSRVGGVYFVSFLVALFGTGLGAGLWEFVAGQKQSSSKVLALSGAVGVVMVCGLLLATPKSVEPVERARIAVVQTNVPQSVKVDWSIEQELEDWDRITQMSIEASKALPGAIVWPETMMPGLSLEDQALDVLESNGIYYRVLTNEGEKRVSAMAFSQELWALSRGLGIPIFVGEDARINVAAEMTPEVVRFTQDERYNSVYLVHQGRKTGERYDKVRLTPFGETMPYISSFPGLEQRLLDFGAKGMKFDLDHGRRRTVFNVPARPASEGEGPSTSQAFRAVTPICFEITVAPFVRDLVYEGGLAGWGERRADVIVNLTNDGWFGEFLPARLQHLQISRWRSLELGVPMVRAANTGISAHIDASGKLIKLGPDGASTPDLSQGVMIADVELPQGATIYGRLGDLTGWGTVFTSLILLVSTFVRRREPKA